MAAGSLKLSSSTDWVRLNLVVDGRAFVAHRTGGDKPALVLCHGITDNGLCWTRVARALEDDFDIVMLNARGHGGSDRSPPTPGCHVADLAGCIDALGLERPALMGHSMGARTVAEFAAEHPDRAARVVLEDPPWRERLDPADANAAKSSFTAFLAAFQNLGYEQGIARGREMNPTWHPDEFPAWVESKLAAADNVTDAVTATRWQDIVPRIHCPALLIAGEVARGGIVSEAVLAAAAAANPRIRTARLAGAGHNVRRERFTEFVALVRSFLLH